MSGHYITQKGVITQPLVGEYQKNSQKRDSLTRFTKFPVPNRYLFLENRTKHRRVSGDKKTDNYFRL